MYSCNDVVDNAKDKIRKELDSVNCNKVASYSGYSVKQTNMKKNKINNINKILETPLDKIYKFYGENIKLTIN